MTGARILVRYEKACRALAAAVSVDEVMALRETAEKLRGAARIAKNQDLELQALELRLRAERRLAVIISAQKRAGLEVYSERRFCKLIGWTPIASWRARMMGAIPETLFERLVTRRRTSTREMAVIGSMFAGQATHGVEVERCPHCSGVLRVRSGVSADAKAVIDGWLGEGSTS